MSRPITIFLSLEERARLDAAHRRLNVAGRAEPTPGSSRITTAARSRTRLAIRYTRKAWWTRPE